MIAMEGRIMGPEDVYVPGPKLMNILRYMAKGHSVDRWN